MSPAAEMRRRLAGARAAGVPFDDAWSDALAELVPPIQGHFSTAVRVRGEWRAALAGTRATWQAAYEGAPQAGGEVAALELEELVAA